MRHACMVAEHSPTRRQFGSFPSRGRKFCAGSRWAFGLKGMRPHLLQLLLVQPLAVLDPLVVQVLVKPGHTLAVRVHPDGGSSPLPSPLSAGRMLALSPTSVCVELSKMCSPLRADTANGSRTRQKKNCRLTQSRVAPRCEGMVSASQGIWGGKETILVCAWRIPLLG